MSVFIEDDPDSPQRLEIPRDEENIFAYMAYLSTSY